MMKHKMIADGKDSKGYVISELMLSSCSIPMPFQRKFGVKGLSNELMQLRKICQHLLFESLEDKISPLDSLMTNSSGASGKVELLHCILPKFFATGHRVSTLIHIPLLIY
jgi:ATP-dependent helicase STH1/SNF2